MWQANRRLRNIAFNYPKADLITVRANKDCLQWCIISIKDKTGGYRILNEGTLPLGKVMGFEL